MENFLLSKKQSQKTHFDWSHGTCQLTELGPSQEVLFRSLLTMNTLPGTIVDRVPEPQSYFTEAQGKRYCHTIEHLWPIHINFPVGKAPQQQPSKTKPRVPFPSCIPKPSPHLKSIFQPKKYLPQTSLHPPSHIPKPTSLPKSSKPSANTSLPCVEQLLQHLSAIKCSSSYPQDLDQHLQLLLQHQRWMTWRALKAPKSQ